MFFDRHRNHKSHLQYLPTIKGALGMLVNPEHTSVRTARLAPVFSSAGGRVAGVLCSMRSEG
jgi:hypothetical protein